MMFFYLRYRYSYASPLCHEDERPEKANRLEVQSCNFSERHDDGSEKEV